MTLNLYSLHKQFRYKKLTVRWIRVATLQRLADCLASVG